MAVSQVRINGKGHHLCLSRTLQASLEEEIYADVRIVVISSASLNDDHPRVLRANSSVLAAASPILAHILKERTEDDEAVLILDGYQYNDIANLLQYIYTGQTYMNRKEEQDFRNLLKQLHIGSFEKPTKNKNITKCSMTSEVQLAQTSTRQMIVEVPLTQNKTVISEKQKRGKHFAKHFKKLPVYPSRPLQVPKSEITLQDPLTNQLGVGNQDAMRNGSLFEKTCLKFNLLMEANAVVGNLLDYPRMSDRLGIYFDPQLFSYYRSLVRALPPIRIFLHIADDESDSESECDESLTVKKPNKVYPASQIRDIFQVRPQRKSFFSSRLPVKTMCCVNGKTHIILDGQPIRLDPFIKTIDYPLLDQINQQCQQVQFQQEDESSVELEVEAEARRKRVLLSTLNRLKKDHSRAKEVAHNILKTSSSNRNEDGDGDMETSTKGLSKKGSQNLVICEICGKLISASWIRVHFANHQGEKNYLCEHCGRSFASANLLKSHVHYQHNNQLDLIKCTICGKAFSKKSRLEIHMRIHSDTRPYRCTVPECGKKFHTNGNLRKHSFVHTGEKPHRCGVCDKSFAQTTNLRLHMRTHQLLLEQGPNFGNTQRVRKPEVIFGCEFCPMTFHRIRHFNAHRATHTGEQTTLPCSICQQQFSNINELKQHKRTEHPGTVHQCALCEKSFFKKTAMQRHQATHSEEPAPKPNFPCQHCNSQFTTSAARTVHERTHTGERPFKCPTCAKSFTSKYNFRQHLRMHSEERPFKCNQCNKAFRQPQHLRAHTYTHKSTEEPVPCPICGKMFRNKILVMSHKRIHKQAKVDQSTNNQDTLQQPEASLQFVDSNMEFVNILVLSEDNELPNTI